MSVVLSRGFPIARLAAAHAKLKEATTPVQEEYDPDGFVSLV